MTQAKALSLFSGGLDSILATKLIIDQKIDIEAVTFTSQFSGSEKSKNAVVEAARAIGVPLKVVHLEKDYLKLVRNPKHGYGKNMNPCVDCRIFMLKKAKKYAREIGADFIITGEVLDERPMSQRSQILRLVEQESGLKDKLLRPLSAKLLPKSLAEKKGLVDREKLLGIRGRSRKPQLKLAKKLGIISYPTPAGGCLLTCEEYSKKLLDLFQHKKRITMEDIALLRVGRHFRFGENKIIVGRNEAENQVLIQNKGSRDYYFEVPVVAGPTTLLQGAKTGRAVKVAASLTAFYSDSKESVVKVSFGSNQLDRSLSVSVPEEAEVISLRVGNR
jgi:tRNA U34 2-thiouridine synthase MnmA/TrmU